MDLGALQADVMTLCRKVRAVARLLTCLMFYSPQDVHCGQCGLMLPDPWRPVQAPQAGDDGTYYGLRFTAYLPCMQTEGRFAVLEAVVLQPEPRYTAAFEVREVTATASTTSAYGLGWGADVGISKRLRVAGEAAAQASLVGHVLFCSWKQWPLL